ncbi:MAG: hypothetical protein ACKVS6_02075 [Planctomycetota bacterium]
MLRITFITVLACCAGACSAVSDTMRTVPAFRSEEFVNLNLRRVVFVPLADETAGGADVVAVERAFVEEFEKGTSIEMISLDLSDDRFANNDNPRRTGKYKLETILELAIRHGADAVLFGAVTAFRAYPPQNLGLRLDMISANSGLTLWSCNAHFDMADRDAANAVESAYANYSARSVDSYNWTLTQVSPARFAGLVAAQAVATIRNGK